MSRLLTVATGTLLLTLAATCGPPADATSAAALPDPRLNGAYRFDRNGWIFVHVQGAPDTLGFQHGYLLAPEITDLLRVMPPLLKQQTKKDWAFYRDASEQLLWPKIDADTSRSSTASSPARRRTARSSTAGISSR
jgi:hypothetical protein